MNKKNLLIIGWFFYPKVGGVESIILSQAEYFVNKDYNVSVLTSSVKNLPEKESFRNINIYRKKFINSEKDFSKLINLEFPKLIEELKPDIVHFHNGSYPAASTNLEFGAKNIIALFYCLKSFGIKVIEHAHNAQLKNPEITAKLRDLPWDYIIFVSNFVKNSWDKLSYQSKNASVVYNGIDLKKYTNMKANQEFLKYIKKNNLNIFFPSRVFSMTLPELNKQKNFLLLIKAVEILIKKGIKNFHIIATIKEEQMSDKFKPYNELLKYLDTNLIQDYFTFIKEKKLSEMPGCYAAVDVVCVPSKIEAFSLTYLEGMTSGKIVIGTKTGGTLEQIKNGKNGYLIDPDNYMQLADILEKIILHPEMKETVGSEAKKSVRKFSQDKMMKKIEDIYERLL